MSRAYASDAFETFEMGKSHSNLVCSVYCMSCIHIDIIKVLLVEQHSMCSSVPANQLICSMLSIAVEHTEFSATEQNGNILLTLCSNVTGTNGFFGRYDVH